MRSVASGTVIFPKNSVHRQQICIGRRLTSTHLEDGNKSIGRFGCLSHVDRASLELRSHAGASRGPSKMHLEIEAKLKATRSSVQGPGRLACTFKEQSVCQVLGRPLRKPSYRCLAILVRPFKCLYWRFHDSHSGTDLQRGHCMETESIIRSPHTRKHRSTMIIF